MHILLTYNALIIVSVSQCCYNLYTFSTCFPYIGKIILLLGLNFFFLLPSIFSFTLSTRFLVGIQYMRGDNLYQSGDYFPTISNVAVKYYYQ